MKSRKTNVAKTSKEPIQKVGKGEEVNPPEQPANAAEGSTQEMFDERWQFYFGDLVKKTKDDNAPITIAFVFCPKLGCPIVYTNGHPYELTRACRDLFGLAKAKLDADLSIEQGHRKGQ